MGLLSIVIYYSCYVQISVHYPKYNQSNLSLSIVIAALLVGLLWSVQLVIIIIKALKK